MSLSSGSSESDADCDYDEEHSSDFSDTRDSPNAGSYRPTSPSTENEEEEEIEQEAEAGSSEFSASQTKKATSVRNQANIWEGLLEIRIQLQKCLLMSNKLPQHDCFADFQKEPEFLQKANQAKDSVEFVLDRLMVLQDLLMKKYPETKNLGKSEIKKDSSDNEKEVPSDEENDEITSDEEISSNEQSVSHEETSSSPAGETRTNTKKRKLADYENELSKRHKTYSDYRDAVIAKWNEKTKLPAGSVKNKAATHSILNQIQYVLSNKDKLLKRTRTKRSDYTILGGKTAENPEQENDDSHYNANIFDDDDFYHQLLKQLIEVKSADITDPILLGRHWIQLQSLRSKMKRKIDTRATKGRKLRYTVRPKLVNFMAPIEREQWLEESRSNLFGKLFLN